MDLIKKRLPLLLILAFLNVGLLVNSKASELTELKLDNVVSKVSQAKDLKLSEEEEKAFSNAAENFGLNLQNFKNVLSFETNSNEKCTLVPLTDCASHINCFINIFSKSSVDYMKYYLSGKLKTPEQVWQWFSRSLGNINKKLPDSVTFVVKVGDSAVGRIGIGTLSGNYMEIGYAIEEAYSGRGIMGKAVQASLNFLKHLKENGDSKYNFTRLRATADIGNEPSNKLLKSKGFIKSKKTVNEGNGDLNEYFYNFK